MIFLGCYMAHKVSNIPDDDHVVRRCPRDKQLIVEGEFKGINPSFFELRTYRKEDYLSCNWLEYFRSTFQENLRKTKEAILSKLLKPVEDVDKAVVLNVGKIKSISKSQGLNIRVLHENKVDPSYSAIRGAPLDNSNRHIFEMWSREAITHIEGLK